MDHLQEVLPAPTLRPLPGTDSGLAGLMVLRNQVLPVLDPWFLTTERPSEALQMNTIVVLSLNGIPIFGLLAEVIGKVVPLASPAPLSRAVRLPAAFSGQCHSSGQSRLLVVNVPALATALGLPPSMHPAGN
jgi:chemotaxis signal transduction protein